MMDTDSRQAQFPVSVFPPLLQKIINATNQAYNFPIPYIGVSLLCALATAIGNTCTLRVNTTWIERPLLYVVLVGNPGSVKSHPMSFAMSPILERDIRNRQEYTKRLAEYRKQIKDGIYAEKPQCRQRVVQDITMEGLFKVLEENPAGICYFCDELADWLGSMDKYRKGGNDAAKWLSIFNGKTIFVDRSGVDDKITIPCPFVNVMGSIQPKVFARQFSGRFVENGLLSRMMVVYNDGPDDMPYDSYADIPESLVRDWHSLIGRILDLTDGFYELGEAEYSLSDGARAAFSTWSDTTTDLMNASEPMIMREFFQKIKYYVYRIALILQVLDEACSNLPSDKIVHSKSMILAGLMGNYMLDNARQTLELLSLYEDFADMPKAYQRLYDYLPERFSKAQANMAAKELELSESTVDKFCKRLLGKRLVRDSPGVYRKEDKGSTPVR